MENKFGAEAWKKYIPKPVFDEHPEYEEIYLKAWELAFDHIKNISGMPQNPYMDEAFCATQVWIWDTCFMTLFCKFARKVFPGVETLNNFYKALYEGVHLPQIIVPEDEPEWTHTIPGTSHEIMVHIADNPPLFAWSEYENALMSGDKEYVKELLYKRKVLQKHYEWIEQLPLSNTPDTVSVPVCMISEENGYKWEGGCSGMDNTPRGRVGEHAIKERPNNPDMYWIDAICQQALSALILEKLYLLVGDTESAKAWNEKHSKKKQIINDLYWDDTDGFYYDIDCNTHEFYKIMSIASYWTMTSETATKERAEKLVQYAQDPKKFGGFIPLISLSRSDNDYDPEGRYWRGGFWLPTAYAALKGFGAYGYYDEAHEAALKIVEHMYRTYKEYDPHTIWECYNPEEYKPATSTGGKNTRVKKDFCGWSALGPISIYLEYVLGFRKIDTFEKKVYWSKPNEVKGKIGIKNLSFGSVITDIIAVGNECTVVSNETYTLEINGKAFEIQAGKNTFRLTE